MHVTYVRNVSNGLVALICVLILGIVHSDKAVGLNIEQSTERHISNDSVVVSVLNVSQKMNTSGISSSALLPSIVSLDLCNYCSVQIDNLLYKIAGSESALPERIGFVAVGRKGWKIPFDISDGYIAGDDVRPSSSSIRDNIANFPRNPECNATNNDFWSKCRYETRLGYIHASSGKNVLPNKNDQNEPSSDDPDDSSADVDMIKPELRFSVEALLHLFCVCLLFIGIGDIIGGWRRSSISRGIGLLLCGALAIAASLSMGFAWRLGRGWFYL